ncbi:MAG: peptide deformylase [Syntrophorhabdaceae bacterium]|nr:peptide deformylase [Syntrophorhabdaceae bacterium]
MVRDILAYPDSFLSKRAAPVSKIDEQLKKLIRDMFDTMYESEGIGLAATQVGVDKRVIVLDVSPSDESGVPIALVNPEIVGCDGPDIAANEGCLSVPGVTGEVVRPEAVLVQGMNENGEPVMLRAGGILGRAIQHEIDHLDGVLFIDRIQPSSATTE